MKKITIMLGLLMVGIFGINAIAQVPGQVPDKYSKTYSDNAYLRFGNSQDTVCGYNTTQTPDAFVCGLSTDSETMILMQKGDISTDMGLSDYGTPTLVIANSDPTKYLTISHDGTNAVIDSSTGVVSFPDGIDLGTSGLTFGTSLVFEGATADPYETTLTVTDPTADRTVQLPNASGFTVLSTADAGSANSIFGSSNALSFEGATSDPYDTNLTVADPTATRTITLPDASGTVLLSSSAISVSSVTSSGNITSTNTGTIGWSIVTGANTACTTTCTNACVFGWDTTAGDVAVDCADATADKCLCAGSN